MIPTHVFRYTLPDPFLRTLDRRQYKEVSRYLRVLRNQVEAEIDFGKVGDLFSDVVLYGTGVYHAL